MPAAVFVSYSHNDRERVVPWVELLQRAGVTVWMDKAGIGGARLWPQEIAEAIQGCQVLLLMLSSSSAASANVVREVNLAMQGDKPILPLLLEPVTIPTALQYPLAGIQQIELFHGECDAQRDPVLSALAGLGVAVPKGPPEVEPIDTPTPESIPTNLPAELTSFIGREQEIAEVKQRLATARLLTLIGAGGTGKTRLALQVAASVLQSYPDGVWLVELAALADPAFVLQEVASVLGVREEPGLPLTATLLDHLRARQLLLVLDNCEHLVSVCATFTQTLLRACPQVRVLATSREALRAAGEIPWRVPSLALPPEPEDLPPAGAGRAQALIQYEAARLFIERAGASRPGFVVTEATAPAIAEICRRLDGIPLAIELAAARVKVLPVEEICRRLDDRFRLLTEGERTALPRQQTLRALIDWSYDLLTEAERALLRRLSVFAGGFSLSAVEAICSGEGVGAEEMLDLLSQLIDKSLVLFQEQEGEGRYWLQETIRQYGAEKLQEAGEVAWVQEGHRRWFLALAEEAEPELRGTAREEWRERLEREHDNIRAALASSVEAGDAESGLRLGGARPAGRAPGAPGCQPPAIRRM